MMKTVREAERHVIAKAIEWGMLRDPYYVAPFELRLLEAVQTLLKAHKKKSAAKKKNRSRKGEE
jgi:hypothetical protein